MRRAAKTDANASAIDAVLIAAGASVAKTDAVGSGFPDRVVGFGDKNFLLEYKDGKKYPSQRKLTSQQVKWHEAWKGQVTIVHTPKEALEVIFGLRILKIKADI